MRENDHDDENNSMSLEPSDKTRSPLLNVTRLTPSDIIQGLREKPVQPTNVAFPRESGCSGGSFSPSWYGKHTWLEYSMSKDAGYCYPCRFFSTGVQRGEKCFI